jgi:hypothetical protein
VGGGAVGRAGVRGTDAARLRELLTVKRIGSPRSAGLMSTSTIRYGEHIS